MMSTHKKPVAVFDIDGTLIRWQLYHAITDALARKGLIQPKTYQHMRKARMDWKRRTHSDSFKDYERQVVTVYDKAVTSLRVSQFQQVARQVFNEYKDQAYTYSRQLIGQLKQKGYLLLAISGSQKEIVAMVAKHYGFDDWVGSTYVHKMGKFTGEKHIASFDKSQILQQLLDKHSATLTKSVGVGDSESDIAMLEMVKKPIVFNPNIALFKHAQKQGWPIVVERKNVVYELKQGSGGYKLT